MYRCGFSLLECCHVTFYRLQNIGIGRSVKELGGPKRTRRPKSGVKRLALHVFHRRNVVRVDIQNGDFFFGPR
jgi:hypothetical protein